MCKIILLAIVIGVVASQSLFDRKKAVHDDIKRNATELIESRNLKAEVHTVTTSDKYILTVFHIINPYWKGKTKGTLLLQHGLNGNAHHWMENTAGKVGADGNYTEMSGVTTDCTGENRKSVGNTIAFVLSACGYDVWLGNNRGTRYSTGHETLNSAHDISYWKYTIDDLMEDDIAMINYVKKATKSKTIGYIGHSLGTSQMFQLLTQNKEMNTIIKPYIAIAPVGYLGGVNKLLQIFFKLEPFLDLINGPLYLVPTDKLQVVDRAISNVCQVPVVDQLCESFFFLLCGANYDSNDPEKFAARVAPDGTSFKVAAQLANRANRGNFRKYDYKLANYHYYGSLLPPEYDLGKITNKNIIMISGQNDKLGDPEDVQKLRKSLTVRLLVDYVVPETDYQHADFIWANNAGEMVNSLMLKHLPKVVD